MSCITTSSLLPPTSSLPPTSTSSSVSISSGATVTNTNDQSSIDNFLTDILSAVTLEDTSVCSCDDRGPVFARCVDCNQQLCEACFHAHRRYRLTRNHRITRFNRAVTPPSSRVNSMGSSSQHSSISSCNTLTTVCDTHKEPYRIYCQSCHVPSCTDCVKYDHNGHHLVYIEEAVESAKSANQKLNAETRMAIQVVREAIDSVQRMSESVELRSLQVATEIRNSIKRYMIALQDREVSLLKRIDNTRQLKGKLLMSQMESLRIAFSRLTKTSDMLNETAESFNTFDVMCANEKAANELKQIRTLRPEMIPCEDDVITYVPPDNGFLRLISTIGNVIINRPRMSPRIARAPSRRDSLALVPLIKSPILQTRSDSFNEILYRTIYGTRTVIVKDSDRMPSLLFGKEGEKDGQLCRPWGICCNHLGQYIVADRSNNRIQALLKVFNSRGQFLYKFGRQGSGPGEFDRPASVAVNPHGEIIVCDKDNHRVQMFKADSTFIRDFGEKGNRNGQFNYPWDVACNALSQIVVSDTRNHRIQLFTRDGLFLSKYGFEGPPYMWKQFDSPRGVCFTPSGAVLVTDFNNHRLVVVDSQFRQAQFLGGNLLQAVPTSPGVVCDDAGNIVVADSRNQRIQVFDSDGNFVWYIGGVAGRGPGEFDRPSGLCLNRRSDCGGGL
ncbi:hypothetical protein NQ317_009087, partial [Molorchus minor]